MRATAGTGRHRGLAVIGALIVTIATMSPAFAGAGAGPSTSTTAPTPSTSTTYTWTTAPPTTVDPVFDGVSTTLGVSDPSEFFPSSTNPPATFVMTVPMTAVTSVEYDFQGPDAGPGETVDESPSTEGGEGVAFRGRGATAGPKDSTPAATQSPSGSTTTTDPARPVSRTQDSAALAAASGPVATESGVSLFWPVVLGLCCLLLVGGPIAVRRLRHSQ